MCNPYFGSEMENNPQKVKVVEIPYNDLVDEVNEVEKYKSALINMAKMMDKENI